MPLITEVAKRLRSVAPKLASALPTQCPRCEWPLASSIDLAAITCVNPRCPAKIEDYAYQAIQGIGVTTVSPDDVPLERAYKPIKDGGVPYVQARLAIPNDTVSLHAGRVYETLLEFEEDLTTTWKQLEKTK